MPFFMVFFVKGCKILQSNHFLFLIVIDIYNFLLKNEI